MGRFGINAKADEAAYLFTFAEAVLLDRRTGREIWNVNIHGRDRITPLRPELEPDPRLSHRGGHARQRQASPTFRARSTS